MFFTEAQNLDITREALNSVFYEEFGIETSVPGRATANTGDLFKVIQSTQSQYIYEVNKPVGLFTQIGETQNVPAGIPQVADKVNVSVLDYAQSLPISKDLFDDNMFNNWSENVRQFAQMARITQDITAFNLFNNAFGTTLTADGIAAVSASHTNIQGATVSNSISGALSDTTLNTAIVALGQQVNQANVIMGGEAAILVVPTALWKHATQLLETVLQPDGALNNINVYSMKYSIKLYTSPYLSAAQGGSDTQWFLLTNNHSVHRVIRQGIQTALTDWSYSNNRTYNYQANYREAYYIATYAGLVGSTGL